MERSGMKAEAVKTAAVTRPGAFAPFGSERA